MVDLTFDTMRDETGKSFTVDEFLALPLHLRIALILQGKLTFLRGGEPVDQSKALKSLMDTARR